MTTILVIEDSEALLNDIVEMLSLEGYETLRAPNGEVGVDLAMRHHPDLIVCDVRMPVKDGYGVLNDLRKAPDTSTIPFIFLTARTGRGEVRQGMELGADDYLTKPFTADELMASVSMRLERHATLSDASEKKLNRLRRSIVLALPHELRTPLNSILGFSEILMTDSGKLKPEKIKEMSGYINKASMRLFRLIENYLVYANLEIMSTDDERAESLRRGRTRYPSALIEQHAIDKSQHFMRADDLKLDNPYVDCVLAIAAENLGKVVQELADNAFKFSEVGSPVSVLTRRDGNMFEITVHDEGRGMTPEELESVGAYMQFERAFYEQQGVGFGLVIAKRMLELHGGRLELESVHGEHTTVRAYVPVASENGTA